MYEISRSGTTFDHNEYYINNLVLCSEHMYSKQYQLSLRKATNATEYFDVFFASARHSCQSLKHTQVNINCRASHAKKKKMFTQFLPTSNLCILWYNLIYQRRENKNGIVLGFMHRRKCHFQNKTKKNNWQMTLSKIKRMKFGPISDWISTWRFRQRAAGNLKSHEIFRHFEWLFVCLFVSVLYIYSHKMKMWNMTARMPYFSPVCRSVTDLPFSASVIRVSLS